MANRLLQFLTHDIWRIRVRKLPWQKAFGLRTLRILLVSFKEFASDKCSLRASALTYYSLLSIVPIFAMAFGLAKGFGLDKLLRDKILDSAGNQQEIIVRVIDFSENLLQNTKGGVVAGIGLLFLFWTVIKVFGNIETSFNDIWGVKRERSLGRKFTDYLSLMLICPVFFVVASSATVFIATQITMITAKISILGYVGPVILKLLKLLPFAVFWSLLTFIYMFMPNTTIRFKSALLGGVVAGTVYQVMQWAYIHFQIGVSKAGAIYGSFAALPLFLMWLQISWLIVLFGAELAFAHQNEATYEFEPDCARVSPEMKKILALRITRLCVSRFCQGVQPASAEAIADELEMPIRLTRELLFQLTEAGLLIMAQGYQEKERYYQPARDVEDMTIQYVLSTLDRHGSDSIPVIDDADMAQIRQSLKAFGDVISQSPENIKLKNLASPQKALPRAYSAI